MGQISVDRDLCKRDGVCVAVCPSRTLIRDEDGFPKEAAEIRCILCGQCAAACACGALTHTGLPDDAFLEMPTELPTPAAMDGLLKSRRSVRAFKDKPVSREVMEALLDIARRAPTASNSQKLHWIVVDGKAKVHELAQEMIDGAGPGGLSPSLLQQWNSGYDFALRGAPTLVVACAPKDYLWGKPDCAIALTYLELAAEARGIGVCWAGYLTRIAASHRPLQEKLQVPEGYAVCGGLMMGESKYTYHRIPPRKPLSVQWI